MIESAVIIFFKAPWQILESYWSRYCPIWPIFTYSTKKVSIFFISTLLVLYLYLKKQTYKIEEQGKRQQNGKELKRQKNISQAFIQKISNQWQRAKFFSVDF